MPYVIIWHFEIALLHICSSFQTATTDYAALFNTEKRHNVTVCHWMFAIESMSRVSTAANMD